MPTKDKEKLKAARARADAKRAGRTRNFATVVYPESAPTDWMQRLDAYHVPALISPLHDKDVNPSGEPKKPHYHVLLMFEGPKDFDTQVKPIFDKICGVGREIVNSSRGYARYLCHLDNPEKFQYEPSEVRCMSGADFYEVTQLPTDERKMLGEIIAFIQKCEIYSFAEFIDVSKIYHPEWFALIVNSKGWIIKEFIKSLAWEKETRYERKIIVNDEKLVKVDTGEIIF